MARLACRGQEVKNHAHCIISLQSSRCLGHLTDSDVQARRLVPQKVAHYYDASYDAPMEDVITSTSAKKTRGKAAKTSKKTADMIREKVSKQTPMVRPKSLRKKKSKALNKVRPASNSDVSSDQSLGLFVVRISKEKMMRHVEALQQPIPVRSSKEAAGVPEGSTFQDDVLAQR